VFKRTSHGRTGSTETYISGLLIRVQLLSAKPAVCISVREYQNHNKTDISLISFHSTDQVLEICVIQLETKACNLIILLCTDPPLKILTSL
jgi:hypothetical protein